MNSIEGDLVEKMKTLNITSVKKDSLENEFLPVGYVPIPDLPTSESEVTFFMETVSFP